MVISILELDGFLFETEILFFFFMRAKGVGEISRYFRRKFSGMSICFTRNNIF